MPRLAAPEDLASALHELPVFPLQETVLFPGVLLPLHIFEPRYITMVRDAIATHRAIAVARVRDPSAGMSGSPAIVEIAGVGTVLEHTQMPNGRINLLLLGRARVRLQELHFRSPYRRAIATLVARSAHDATPLEVATLQSAVVAFLKLMTDRDPSVRVRLPHDAEAGVYADACAHHLVLDARDRQRTLETRNVGARVRLVTELLTVQRAMLGAGSQTLH